MSRRYRVVVSLVLVIVALLGIYRFFWTPYLASRSQVEPSPLVPNLSLAGPTPHGPTATAAPEATKAHPPSMSPDGRYPFYLGISENGVVTIYRWVEDHLAVVQELSQLSADQLRSEDKAELEMFVGADSEEEIWQKVEGLTH